MYTDPNQGPEPLTHGSWISDLGRGLQNITLHTIYLPTVEDEKKNSKIKIQFHYQFIAIGLGPESLTRGPWILQFW